MTSDTFTANPLKTASSSEVAAAASSLKIQRSRRRRMLTRLGCLIGLVVLFAALYQFAFVNPKFFSYAMSIRLPRLIVLLTAGTAISAAAIIFQTIIRNNIVTPCLLGMNSPTCSSIPAWCSSWDPGANLPLTRSMPSRSTSS